MKNLFDPKNPRIKYAHQKKALNNTPVLILNFIFFLLLLGCGIALLIYKLPIGWSFIGFSILPIMLIFWIKNALAEIPIKNTDNFTDLISEDLLLHLNDKMTPPDLAKIIPKTRSGIFLMARFGLTIPFFDQISMFLPKSNEPIFEKTKIIREKTNSQEITGAVLAVSIIENIPNYEQILSQLKLNISDLYQGIVWFNYLNGIVKDSKKPVRSGGIARDFAFGYTPTLQRFAINLSNRYINNSNRIQQAENTEIIQKIIHTFTHTGRQNVALIGAYGSGRSTIVSSFAETLLNANS